jgi:hypothetical protein
MPLSVAAQSSLARGESIAAELPATRTGYRRFVIARPFKDGWKNDPGYHDRPWRFRIFRYEVDARLVDEYLSVGMLKDFEQAFVEDMSALETLLDAWASAAAFRPNRDVLAPY